MGVAYPPVDMSHVSRIFREIVSERNAYERRRAAFLSQVHLSPWVRAEFAARAEADERRVSEARAQTTSLVDIGSDCEPDERPSDDDSDWLARAAARAVIRGAMGR